MVTLNDWKSTAVPLSKVIQAALPCSSNRVPFLPLMPSSQSQSNAFLHFHARLLHR